MTQIKKIKYYVEHLYLSNKFRIGHFFLQIIFYLFFGDLKLKNTKYLMSVIQDMPWDTISKMKKEDLWKITPKIINLVEQLTGKQVIYVTGVERSERDLN